MKWLLTIWLLTFTIIANPGRRQIDPVFKVPNNIERDIKKMADRAVKDSARVIDSIIGCIKPLRYDILPDPSGKYNVFNQLIWYYRIRGRDTQFLYTELKPL